jgi:hypothetical protein
MERIRQYLADRGERFAGRPLFGYLRDAKVEPAQRLAFIPSLTHFVMSFADLYRFFLVEKNPTGRYQELINAHLSEDVHHWKWFLNDLSTAGLDPTVHFTDALRYIWGDATPKTRALTYGICKLSGGLSPLEKLVMVQCIETTGAVALGAVAFAGRDFEGKSGKKLVYFGTHHVDTESEHTLEQESVRKDLDDIKLSEAERVRCLAVVDEAFAYFEEFVDEIFLCAKKPPPFVQG